MPRVQPVDELVNRHAGGNRRLKSRQAGPIGMGVAEALEARLIVGALDDEAVGAIRPAGAWPSLAPGSRTVGHHLMYRHENLRVHKVPRVHEVPGVHRVLGVLFPDSD